MDLKYDVLILTTAKDFQRVQDNYPRMVQSFAPREIIIIGNKDVQTLVEASDVRDRVRFMDENEILPFEEVHSVMQNALQTEEPLRAMTGWYYQQFLKMQYSCICQDDYYLVWDGDTVPCRPLSMFQEGTGIPYLDLKHECHEEYFHTIGRILPGMHKIIQKSFISEHMLINCGIMRAMLQEIEANGDLPGESFFEKIIAAIPREKLRSNSFSEFETYGTYVAFRHLGAYSLRDWHSFRYGSMFFHPEQMTDEDYDWLGRDFDAISFEKNQSVRADHEGIFTKKEYREKLSARQILEIAQQEFSEGLLEVWE